MYIKFEAVAFFWLSQLN